MGCHDVVWTWYAIEFYPSVVINRESIISSDIGSFSLVLLYPASLNEMV